MTMDSPDDKTSPGGASDGGGASAAVIERDDRRTAAGGKTAKATKMSERRDDGAKTGGGDRSRKRSAFDVYKRGQGYWLRVCTSVGVGIIILAGADFVYRQLDVYRTNEIWTMWMQIGIPVLMCVGLGYLLFWAVGVNRRTCDFMIATEGEMKKVNWSTRREIWGSTKVVIVFTLFLAFLLFSVDMVFWTFFGWINVLHGPNPLQALFGVS